MTGGRAFVHGAESLLAARLNSELVETAEVNAAEAIELRALVERHHRYTGSARARALLADWDAAVAAFRVVAPRLDVARLESAHEGTDGEVAEPVAVPVAR